MDIVITTLGVGVGLDNFIGWFPPIILGTDYHVHRLFDNRASFLQIILLTTFLSILGIGNIIPLLLAVFLYTDKMNDYNLFQTNQSTYSKTKPDAFQYDFIIGK